jgi:hypothetical protein
MKSLYKILQKKMIPFPTKKMKKTKRRMKKIMLIKSMASLLMMKILKK